MSECRGYQINEGCGEGCNLWAELARLRQELEKVRGDLVSIRRDGTNGWYDNMFQQLQSTEKERDQARAEAAMKDDVLRGVSAFLDEELNAIGGCTRDEDGHSDDCAACHFRHWVRETRDAASTDSESWLAEKLAAAKLAGAVFLRTEPTLK